MIALTKDKRERLISGIEGYLSVCECDFDKEVYEIALASLMAEPEYNTSSDDGDGEIHLDVTRKAYEKCHPDYRWISYPAPPVPEIKLPSDRDFDAWFKLVEAGDDADWQEPAYQSVEWYQYLSRRQLAKGVFNFYIDEIKRLNGLGE